MGRRKTQSGPVADHISELKGYHHEFPTPLATGDIDDLEYPSVKFRSKADELIETYGRDKGIARVNTMVMGIYWGQYGFPVFSPSPDLCSALIMTEATGETQDFKLPFPSVALKIPAGCAARINGIATPRLVHLCITAGYTKELQASVAKTMAKRDRMKLGRRLHVIVVGDSHKEVKVCMDLSLAEPSTHRTEDLLQVVSQQELDGSVMDSSTLLRLVFNLIEYINNIPVDTRLHETITPSSGIYQGCRTTSIGRDVVLSPRLREIARTYHTSQKVLKNRHVRRGHWTNQPYGPGHSLRKKLWIAPCWVGPEHGTFVERDYRVE